MHNVLFEGVLIGLSIAMPVGPIGMLCIRYALSHGFVAGCMIGLGAACADALYGAVAAFGVTVVTSTLCSYQTVLQLVGALFLCYLGISTYFAKNNSKEVASYVGSSRLFASTFFLTLTNPLTILCFAGVFTAFGAGSQRDPIILTCGVFLGSMLWWVLLSSSTSYFKKFAGSIWINRASGTVLFGYGVKTLLLA